MGVLGCVVGVAVAAEVVLWLEVMVDLTAFLMLLKMPMVEVAGGFSVVVCTLGLLFRNGWQYGEVEGVLVAGRENEIDTYCCVVLLVNKDNSKRLVV